MIKLLKGTYTYPLEREYEGWILSQIEDYFSRIGTKCAIFAVSPSEEKFYPADDVVHFDGILFSLQFKKTKFASSKGAVNFTRIWWDFRHPTGQLDRVLDNPEIFYCLPTFLNREWRKTALDHSIFWRPTDGTSLGGWYDNPKARSSIKKLKNSHRWGLFVEELLSDRIGLRVTSMREVQGHIEKVLKSERKSLEPDQSFSELAAGVLNGAGSERLYYALVYTQSYSDRLLDNFEKKL